MKTIISYLDNMFASLPKTIQMHQLKEEIAANMEEKYNELKDEGKSENEAIGIVISEFGNIEELINEFDITFDKDEEKRPTLENEAVNDYLRTSKKSGILIGVGVGLCIYGVALLILLTQLVEDGRIAVFSDDMGDVIGLIPLLLFVATAVGLFIYAGMLESKFKYLDSGFELSVEQQATVKESNEAFHKTYTKSIIIGVIICILSPLILILITVFNEEASVYGVVALLSLVAIAIYMFIYYGKIKDSYNKLLKMNEYAKAPKSREKENKIIGAVAAIIWPLAVCIFLISGLVFHQWHINWIIFPITGLIFAMFSGAYSILKS